MGASSTAKIVVVPFPFSDLSKAKLRPAVVLAEVERGDLILCQITSNPYAESNPVVIRSDDVEGGQLAKISYARPTKLFTAHGSLVTSTLGSLNKSTMRELFDRLHEIFRTSATNIG